MKKLSSKFISWILILNIIFVSSFTITVNAASNKDTIYYFILNELGLNRAAACGILANIEKESGFRPDLQEYGYTWEEGAGYGICQWTNYPRTASYGRRTNLVNWCSSNGYDYRSLNGQLYFLKHELETDVKPGVYSYLKGVSNDSNGAYNAGYKWCYSFEVPAGYNTGVSDYRGECAVQYWNSYNPDPKPIIHDNPYPEPTRNLSLQSPYCTGDDVKWVQWCLVKLGYGLDIDGIYGKDTHAQVANFQRDNGLTVDGICGAGTRSKLKEKTPLTHNYSVSARTEPTCTQNGSVTYKCSCGASYSETLNALGHSYTTRTVSANCTTQGYTLHTCSRCGNNYKDTYTNALGHDYKLTTQKAATCTADGEKIYSCSRCGSTKTETVKATGHNYTTKVITATCAAQGYTLHTCSNCGSSYKDTYISASDHDYSLTSQKAATCTANGEKIYTCNHCGSTKTEKIKATGHKYTETVVAPTSTEQGYTLHICSVCGHSYKDNYTDKLLEQLVNNSTLSAETVKLGATVTVSAKASGGAGSYQYNVLYKQKSQSKWTTAQAYKANTTVSIKPENATTYDICVKVKDSNGTEVKKYFTVKVTNALQNNSTISNTEINLGDTITVNGKATGGTGGYTYAVYYKKTSDSKWSTAQAYKNNSTIAIKPINATTYDICVKIKDSDGTEVKKYFNVKVTDPMKNVSIISSTSVTLGDTITVTGKASGGTNFYVYAVYCKESQNTKWTVVQDYSSNSIVMIKPDKATKYNICVKVKDSSGTIEKKYFDVTVNPKLSELINTSKLSATSIKLGDTIQVICSAQGGTGLYQYAIYYKKINDTKWTTKQSYSPNSITDIKPPESSVYDVCIKVKDNLNNENKKYFTLTVK